MTLPSLQQIVEFLVWITLVIVVFSYSVSVRRPFFGRMFAEHHHQLTAATLLFSSNWYNDGAFADRFLLLHSPQSIEFPTLQDRNPYPSYPPGQTLGVFLLAKLMATEPSVGMIQGLNLFSQLLIAMILGALAWSILDRTGFGAWVRLPGALFASFFYILNPCSMYFHQNVYFSDQAVLLPFAVAIAFEVLDLPKRRRIFEYMQIGVVFWGILTDWLFVFVTAVICLCRLLDPWLRDKDMSWRRLLSLPVLRPLFALIAPICVVVVFYVIGVRFSGGSSYAHGKMLERTGFNGSVWDWLTGYNWNWWAPHLWMGRYFGPSAPRVFLWSFSAALLITMFMVIRRGVWKKTYPYNVIMVLKAAIIVTLPCFLQVYVLRQHSDPHDFSVMKFAIPFALHPAIILPCLVGLLIASEVPEASESCCVFWSRIWQRPEAIRLAGGVFVLGLIVMDGIHLRGIHPLWIESIPPLLLPGEYTAQVIHRHARFSDVWFSPDFLVDPANLQLLAVSRKNVYQVHDIAEVRRFLDEHNLTQRKDVSVVLLFDKKVSCPALQDVPSERIEDHDWHGVVLRIAVGALPNKGDLRCAG
ncbi:MAG: hypothetical protein HQL02_07595 [Nitrospirae bacterium]|nr:hypothetical protein [Nitrospirota bacterium]